MKIKKIVALFLVMLICFPVAGCSKSEKVTVFLDANGEIIGRVTSEYGSVTPTQEYYSDYLITAMRETLEIICRKQGVNEDQAMEYLYNAKYTVKTELDSNLQTKLYESLKSDTYRDISEYAVALTDLKGNLVASYSSEFDNENLINGSLKIRYPCSAIKPLSVYSPLLESGSINWSSLQKDTYTKEIQGDDGTKRKWPANASGVYTNENVTVADAIKESYNTIAVKWLQELTVPKSYEFLDKLGLNTDYEKKISNANGDDDVLGNIALGYLRQGVTTVDMAGYYQMFANGGNYSKPTAVTSIDREDKNLYKKENEQIQIISNTTAYIMNKMLIGVVEGGTGKEAKIANLAIGGKTGTSDENADNWFVGFTPEYSCAVWHSTFKENGNYKNIAPRIFSDIFKSVFDKESDNKNYPVCESVKQMAYCADSGGKLTSNCRRLGSGYYLVSNPLDSCNIH